MLWCSLMTRTLKKDTSLDSSLIINRYIHTQPHTNTQIHTYMIKSIHSESYHLITKTCTLILQVQDPLFPFTSIFTNMLQFGGGGYGFTQWTIHRSGVLFVSIIGSWVSAGRITLCSTVPPTSGTSKWFPPSASARKG